MKEERHKKIDTDIKKLLNFQWFLETKKEKYVLWRNIKLAYKASREKES